MSYRDLDEVILYLQCSIYTLLSLTYSQRHDGLTQGVNRVNIRNHVIQDYDGRADWRFSYLLYVRLPPLEGVESCSFRLPILKPLMESYGM